MKDDTNCEQEGDSHPEKRSQEEWIKRNGILLEKEYLEKEYIQATSLTDFDLKEHLSNCSRALAEMSEKYFDLVWMARKPHPNADPDFYEEMADDIREGCLAAQKEVYAKYPDEVAALSGPQGDWQHGFNSGCLAAFRFAKECLDGFVPDPIHQALEDFPMLDT